MARPKKERATVKVTNIPYTVTAIDLLDFLESIIGKDTVFAIEIFSEHKNWKSRGHGRVQFETLEAKSKATQLAIHNKLVFKGFTLSLSTSYEDVVARPIEPRYRASEGDLHVGLMENEDLMRVVETWKNVRVWVMPERSSIGFQLEYDHEWYKLEVQFDDVFESFGCCFQGQDPAVLLKLKFAPKIFKKISGPNLSPRFSADRYHFCKDDLGFLWVRSTDFSNNKSIGQSSAFCWKIEDESFANDIFSSLPYYKKYLKDLHLKDWDQLPSKSTLLPLVTCEDILKLDYVILFQINSLVHANRISLASVNSELIDFLSVLSLDTAVMALQKLHKLSHTCYEPLSFIKNQVHNLGSAHGGPSAQSRLINDNIMSCHRALITPTKIYCMGPELESSNYVVKNFAAHASDFIRVTFVEEDWSKLNQHVVSTSVEQGLFSKPFKTDIYHRVLSVLRDGIVIGNKRFEFLAFSASQLRNHSVWMFASNDELKAEDIRQWMGSFSKIRSISKCAARMGQLFSSSKPTLVVPAQDVEVIPDIEVNTDGVDYCFSDGIGKISLSFARQVAQKCGAKQTPSAFQIRYGGYKGVIAVDRNSFRKLSLRSSMLKFESKNRMLNITKCCDAMPCYLNREIVTLLTTLGVDDCSFEALLLEHLHFLGSMLTSTDAALAVLESIGQGDGVVAKMLHHGYKPNAEPYLLMTLRSYLDNQLSDIRSRCRIHVSKGRILVGCLDETGILNYGQVFVRITLKKTELESGDQSYFHKVDEKTAIVVGKVVVTKNPCLHPGDVRVLDAIYEVALEEKGLTDCLIFPQKGERPHPNECSGGDLDGDLYFISWDEKMIPPRTVAPMDYTACKPRIMDHNVTMEEIQRFFVDYIISDTLGTISTAHLILADREPEKALSPKCLQLASLHSMAVDFAKTGVPADMPRVLKPREYPDFMERWDKPTYISQGVLGKLYRITVAATMPKSDFNWSEEVAQAAYDYDLEVPGFETFIDAAKTYKEMYKDKMSSLLIYYEATREEEMLTGNLKTKSMYLQKDNRRYTEMKDRILLSVKNLQKEAKGWFESSCSVEDRQKMASAWYYVTYHSSHCQDSENCLGFPWTLADVLLAMKSASQKQS